MPCKCLCRSVSGFLVASCRGGATKWSCRTYWCWYNYVIFWILFTETLPWIREVSLESDVYSVWLVVILMQERQQWAEWTVMGFSLPKKKGREEKFNFSYSGKFCQRHFDMEYLTTTELRWLQNGLHFTWFSVGFVWSSLIWLSCIFK